MPRHIRCSALAIALLTLSGATISVAEEQARWPYNLPAHVKYFPEDEPLVRRSEVAQEKLKNEQVVGVKKMSLDEGEMFFLDYWTFASDEEGANPEDPVESPAIVRRQEDILDSEEYTNSSMGQSLWPVFALHTDEQISQNPALARFLPESLRRSLERRFQCPTGTSACTSINRPNSCCATGETCQLITDTGLGDVGCCPAGQTCSGNLSGCQSGYTSCPNNPGGGCCIPGYACYDEGCAISSTATVIVTPTTTLSPTSSAASSSASSSESTLPLVTLTSTTTVTVAPSPATSRSSTSTTPSTSTTSTTSSSSSRQTTATVVVTTTTTSLPTSTASLTCSTNFRSCPASLGGGCCPTDRACGSPSCPALSSTQSLSPPVRGTTGDSSQTTSSSTTTSVSYSGCPTGFYACSAFYQGGCCRVGRDCSKTSCPAIASTTLIDTNSLTIAAPTGSGISATIQGETGTCPTGWALCPTSAGGGCCPSGYACGTSCTVEASASQTGYGSLVNKLQPSSGAKSIFDGKPTVQMAVLISFTVFMYLIM